MPKDFFVSARFRMAVPQGLQGIDGGLIIPSGIAEPMLLRRDLDRRYPHLKRRLLDPQLYLAGLSGPKCRNACVNLASYGWFGGPGVEEYDSKKLTQSQWRTKARARIASAWAGSVPTTVRDVARSVHEAIRTQVVVGCEAVILPSPLTVDPAADYSVESHWLDEGLATAAKLAPGLPRMATIAISDTCLRGIDPWQNRLLDVVLDQVTARQPEGAYLVLELANEHGYYCGHTNTVASLLRVTRGLKVGGTNRVFVAFCGVAGLLALAAGADSWSTGWYRGERRLRLVDFEQPQGRAIPSFYSHNLASELHVQSDLDKVVAGGMLRDIADLTPASRGLLAALGAGKRVQQVQEWQYRQSNVSAAIEHFLATMARETAVLSPLSTAEQLDYARRWLDRADKLASKLYVLGPFNSRTELDHQASWQTALQRFTKEEGL